jgi:tellurium resistance protein TerZ
MSYGIKNMNHPLSNVAGATITVQVLAGRNLVAKDRTLFRRQLTTSDPYVKVRCNNKTYGRTRTIDKNCLSPTWNETIRVEFGADEAQDFLVRHAKQPSMIDLCIMDKDLVSFDDPMGIVRVPIPYGAVSTDDNGGGGPMWYPVTVGEGKYHCKNATGELQVKVSFEVRQMLQIHRGNLLHSNQLPYGQGRLTIGLSWDVELGRTIDLDSCCVAIDTYGNVLMNETVYYGNLSNPNGSIVHAGDETTGAAGGDDEIIRIDLNRVSPQVLALYILLFVAGPTEQTLAGVKSAQVRILSTDTKAGICRFLPSDLGESHTAVVFVRIARYGGSHNEWSITPITECIESARDFGSLIPELKGYTRDLVPKIVINPSERVAIMRKGGTIRIADYLLDRQPPEWLTFGLAWNVTYGVNIDLDAAAILLDEQLQPVDTVWFGQRSSREGSVQHGGDEREGDAICDDEKINLSLSNIPAQVAYIGLVINSYSGQELDDVALASCHLFDPKTNVDVARYTLTNCNALNHHTALVMGCLYRSSTSGTTSTCDWCLRIISEPAQGRTVHDNVDELQRFLRSHPPQTPSIPPEPEIILNAMPDCVPVEEDIIVVIPEEEIHVLLQ